MCYSLAFKISNCTESTYTGEVEKDKQILERKQKKINNLVLMKRVIHKLLCLPHFKQGSHSESSVHFIYSRLNVVVFVV